jgi:magnesium transporter
VIRILHYSPKQPIRTSVPLTTLPELLKSGDDLVWVDFEGEPPEVCEPVLLNTFGFHPLAVDDALQESHVPRIDDWGSYLYIVLAAVGIERRNGSDICTVEVDVFLGDNYIVTHHDAPVEALERVWSLAQRDVRHLSQGADHLLYRVVDEMVVDYVRVVDEFDEDIEEVEKAIFDRPTPDILERTFGLKRSLLQLRRLISPQREVMNKLARDDYQMIDDKDRVYFRDVYDHLVRLHDINESLRDLVTGALETYLSVVNNRMNDIMKTLTLITTLFMPLSFVAGFFGMNFFEPSHPFPEWTGGTAFNGTMIIMAVLPALMYLWMRRRGWM